MIPEILLLIALAGSPLTGVSATVPLASHTISMNDRYGNSFVNDVFKDNILLTMKYMAGDVKAGDKINWDEVEKPFHYEFTLKPGEEFAFHDILLPSYSKNVVKTMGAHYNYDEGFKSDGFLTGDGVCHLASLIYWAAKDAGLTAYAPSNHNFAVIPDIPKEYGVAIFVQPVTKEGANSNLYIVNNKEKPVHFVFDYKDSNLTVNITEDK